MRSEKTKRAFVKYLNENKDLRFWQALAGFSGYTISVSDEAPITTHDTFYFEELRGDKPPKVNGSTKKEKL